MSHAAILVALEGTPSDIEKAVGYQMAPFDEGETWFKKGSRWDWWQIGGRFSGRLAGNDVIHLSQWDVARFKEHQEKRARDIWGEYQKTSDSFGKSLFGLEPDETLETLIARMTEPDFPAFPAFLHNRRWDEGSRMGWFGCRTATECEIEGKKPRRCFYRSKKTGAVVCSWNEDDKTWYSKFKERFIDQLSPNTTLVVVDYHV